MKANAKGLKPRLQLEVNLTLSLTHVTDRL